MLKIQRDFSCICAEIWALFVSWKAQMSYAWFWIYSVRLWYNQWCFLWIHLQMNVVSFCLLLWYYNKWILIPFSFYKTLNLILRSIAYFLPCSVDARCYLNQLNTAKSLLNTLSSCRLQLVPHQCHLFCIECTRHTKSSSDLIGMRWIFTDLSKISRTALNKKY